MNRTTPEALDQIPEADGPGDQIETLDDLFRASDRLGIPASELLRRMDPR